MQLSQDLILISLVTVLGHGGGLRCSFLMEIQGSAASSLLLLSLISRLTRWRIGGPSFLQNRINGYLSLSCPISFIFASRHLTPLPRYFHRMRSSRCSAFFPDPSQFPCLIYDGRFSLVYTYSISPLRYLLIILLLMWTND